MTQVFRFHLVANILCISKGMDQNAKQLLLFSTLTSYSSIESWSRQNREILRSILANALSIWAAMLLFEVFFLAIAYRDWVFMEIQWKYHANEVSPNWYGITPGGLAKGYQLKCFQVEQQLGQNLTHSPIHARSGLIFFLWVSVWMEETYLKHLLRSSRRSLAPLLSPIPIA